MDALDKSVIIAAHPDDENLWFSSILSEVDRIIFCFLTVKSNPVWSEGRRKSLAEYPLENVNSLDLQESEVFWCVDWSHPIITEYGLKITGDQFSGATIYKQNFEALKNKLRKALQGFLNVFTHNPWGEYGHVEHVQVYRAVRAIQQELGFKLWFTNYASNKSINLLAMSFSRIGPHLGLLKTDKSLAKSIARIYKQNQCWTWYDDYEWCDMETFILDVENNDTKGPHDVVLPLNLIDVGVENGPVQKSRMDKLKQNIKRKIRTVPGL